MSINNRRQQIVEGLSARLDRRRETLDRLADATAERDAANQAFVQAYAAAIASGWTKAELAKVGIREPDKRSARRRPARTPTDTHE